MTEIIGKILGSTRKLVCTPCNRLLNRVDPPVIVLLYHRVTTLPSDPQMLAVTPENFRSQMRHIKENFPLLRFEDDWSRLARPTVCVTFDDGYADNALEALPILQELGVPATFFVSTGLIGTRREFWWDELERIVLESPALPSCFPLEDGGSGKTWSTGTVGERQDLYQECVRLFTDGDTRERAALLDRLRNWAGMVSQEADTDRAMSLEELRHLAASEVATVGAHTVTHSRLSSLPESAQREEILSSKRQLENWIGKEVSVFSYPYGKRRQYTKESVTLCREAGFSKAAANFPGQAHRWTDPYQIPRHLVRNWQAEEFATRLRGFWTR